MTLCCQPPAFFINWVIILWLIWKECCMASSALIDELINFCLWWNVIGKFDSLTCLLYSAKVRLEICMYYLLICYKLVYIIHVYFSSMSTLVCVIAILFVCILKNVLMHLYLVLKIPAVFIQLVCFTQKLYRYLTIRLFGLFSFCASFADCIRDYICGLVHMPLFADFWLSIMLPKSYML